MPNLFRFMFCPSCSASSVVSGNLSLVVSGNLKAKTAAIMDTLPKRTIVSGGHTAANISCIETAITPPTLPVRVFKIYIDLHCAKSILDVQWGPDYYIPPDFLSYVLVCRAQSNKSMKTNNIPLKSLIKLQQEMQKKIWNFPKFVRFLGHFFEKTVFLENGHGRH